MSKKQKIWYVYLLCDPDTQIPFYAGKGSGDRAEQHTRLVDSLYDSNIAKKRIIRRIQSEGKEVLVKRIAEFTNELDAYIYELATINAYYEHLVNMRPGGGSRSGHRQPYSPIYSDDDPILTVREAAFLLGYTEEHTRRLARDGKIVSFQVSYGRPSAVRFRRTDIVEYLEQQIQGRRRSHRD
jgi:excisionase family DNA binding protein